MTRLFWGVLQGLEVRLKMAAHVLCIAEGGSFEVHRNFLRANHMLSTTAHNSDILGLHQCLVVRFVSCWMGHCCRTRERLEMVAARAGNYNPVVDEFDLWVARIECLCLVYFRHYYLMLPHCHLGVVLNQTAHPVEAYWLLSVEIRSSTSYLNNKMIVIK